MQRKKLEKEKHLIPDSGSLTNGMETGEFEWGVSSDAVFLILNSVEYPLQAFKIVPQVEAHSPKVDNYMRPVEMNEEKLRVKASEQNMENVIVFKFSKKLPEPFNADSFYMEINEDMRAFVDVLQARASMKAMNA